MVKTTGAIKKIERSPLDANPPEKDNPTAVVPGIDDAHLNLQNAAIAAIHKHHSIRIRIPWRIRGPFIDMPPPELRLRTYVNERFDASWSILPAKTFYNDFAILIRNSVG